MYKRQPQDTQVLEGRVAFSLCQAPCTSEVRADVDVSVYAKLNKEARKLIAKHVDKSKAVRLISSSLPNGLEKEVPSAALTSKMFRLSSVTLPSR